MHEIDWLPEVQSHDQVIAHYAKELAVHRVVPKHERIKRLHSKACFANCGKGTRVRLSAATAGIKVAGGRDSIYLVSEDGEHGSLRLWTSKYQSYSLAKCRIGSIGQWPNMLTLTKCPTQFPKDAL